MNQDLESLFINKYVIKTKRQRYLDFVVNPKRRATFLNMLYHGRDLDKSKFIQLSEFYETVIWERINRISGAINCYIISVDSALDGQEMSVEAALSKIGAYTEGIVLIFGKCEFVYYLGEAPKNEYVSI